MYKIELLYALLKKYRVVQKISTPYHPQTNGQAEISNSEKRASNEVRSLSERVQRLQVNIVVIFQFF